jgi:hypothetical protein
MKLASSSVLFALCNVALLAHGSKATHPAVMALQAKIEFEIDRFNGTFPEVRRDGVAPIIDGIEYGAFDYTLPDGSVMEAFYALPESARHSQDSLPAILISHQWLGISDDEEAKALGIAANLGYVAFALDLYGKGNRYSPGPRALAASLEVLNDRCAAKTKETYSGHTTNVATYSCCFCFFFLLQASYSRTPPSGMGRIGPQFSRGC